MYYARKAEPVGNRFLDNHEKKKRLEGHRARINAMKPSVDNKTPATALMSSAGRNAKREHEQEEKYSKIEHENRLLLVKMSDIMTRKPEIDMKNTTGAYARSLNRTVRAREMVRITHENFRILSRIQSVVPQLSRKKWEAERCETERLLESMATVRPPGKTRLSAGGSLRSPTAAGGGGGGGGSSMASDAAGGGRREGGWEGVPFDAVASFESEGGGSSSSGGGAGGKAGFGSPTSPAQARMMIGSGGGGIGGGGSIASSIR